ncbi:hypothetical protein TUM19329_24830 [Legionella antarctica]|uniref:Uncharacterized protein n=1 Tax=Legionella antarctica TaxID=2708020 RepID=A0A6F8T7W3_9GAMM|nr:hypothetical protein TUM19329_24830 [Legionella antarctica]
MKGLKSHPEPTIPPAEAMSMFVVEISRFSTVVSFLKVQQLLSITVYRYKAYEAGYTLGLITL